MSATPKKSSVKKKSPSKNLTLDLLPPGESGTVLAVNGSGVISKRLMEMGVVPGSVIQVVKTAPLGDPIEISIRQSRLALRKTEARTILVTYQKLSQKPPAKK